MKKSEIESIKKLENAKVDGLCNNIGIVVDRKTLNNILIAITKLQLASSDEEETDLPEVLRFNIPEFNIWETMEMKQWQQRIGDYEFIIGIRNNHYYIEILSVDTLVYSAEYVYSTADNVENMEVLKDWYEFTTEEAQLFWESYIISIVDKKATDIINDMNMTELIGKDTTYSNIITVLNNVKNKEIKSLINTEMHEYFKSGEFD